MGQASITEIAESLQDYEPLKELPKEIGGFKLEQGSGIQGQILNIAAYVNEAAHCRLDITYTSETFDYVPVQTVGLHTFRDERYFSRERDKFFQELREHLPAMLAEMDMSRMRSLGYEGAGIGMDGWNAWRDLPQPVDGFELFITPEHLLPYINGSFIFLDYTDFAGGNQIYFSYNIFRNEIFAEMKQHGLPLTTNVFDVPAVVPDDKKLELLTEHLQKHLLETMEFLKK